MTIIADVRNFVLRDEDGSEHGVFIGKQPRQAALKAQTEVKEQNPNRRLFNSENAERRKCMFSKHGSKLSKLLKIDLRGCRKR